MGPKSYRTGVLIKRGKFSHKHRGTQGRAPYDDGTQDCSDVSTSQRMSRIAGSYQKLGERHGTGSLSEPPKSKHTCLNLDLRLPVSRTVREQIPDVLNHQVCGNTAALGNEYTLPSQLVHMYTQ